MFRQFSSKVLPKTAYITLGTGAVALAISKEFYVVNEETMILASFLITCSVGYKYLKTPFKEFIQSEVSNVRQQMLSSRQNSKQKVLDRIQQCSPFLEIETATKDLYKMSRELTELEAKVFELRQKQVLCQETKLYLDNLVRNEAAIKAKEQKRLALLVKTELEQNLKDENFQKLLLNQSIEEIVKISNKV